MTSGWVGVRCLLRSRDDTGARLYRERVTLWRIGDVEQAVERAEDEVREHAACSPARPPSTSIWRRAYLLANQVGHGAEVFSLDRESNLEPDAYVDRFVDTGTERQRTD